MGADSPVQLVLDGDLAVIRLRDGKVNAMGTSLLSSLVAAVAQAEASRARAVVITGDGRSFSAGLAIPELVELDRAAMLSFIDGFATAMRRVLECSLPTVAAINGHAIAGGCVLALMCDARIMAAGSARIGLNEVQLGIGLPAVVVEPLRARVPATSLTTIALEGALVEPAEALRLGLVEALVDPAALMARSVARATALASAAPLAYAQVKRALLRPTLAALAAHDTSEREAWLDTWYGEEAQRRLRAAVAKLGQRG
jgi:enoyl-CoA hydratase